MSTSWERVARASAGVGDDYARAYAERFRVMAERGEDVHGEAGFVEALLAPPARVLDGGCGTGRIAVRLAELGYDVVGCDVDASMVAVAREQAPERDGLVWLTADLATLDLGPGSAPFDLVLLAGNVVPFLEPGTLGATARRLADHLAPAGLLVAGFGLDAAHLPSGIDPVALPDVDAAMAVAGLEASERWATWDREAFAGGGYVVAAYRRPDRPEGDH